MIAIVDYRMGNLRSVAKAIECVGGQAKIVSTPDELAGAAKVILPGVGAFADAMAHLRTQELIEPIRRIIDDGRPVLGICLGLQLLLGVGFEDGEHAGLDIVGGKVIHFDEARMVSEGKLAIPHMGWNAIAWEPGCPLLAGVEQGAYVYFVHSYHVIPDDPAVIATTTDYGYRFCSSIWRDNLFATQFHPEKSQAVGLKMLSNFVGL